MKSLSREEDVQSTKKAMEQVPSWFIGIPDKRTPWYFISLDYADGYVHWYDSGGLSRRVVCAGGLEGKGFATDDCPICQYVLELYQEAKRLKEEGDDARSKQLKDRANRLHAKAEVQFKAIRGQRTLLKTKTGKEWIADWDTEEEDSTAGIGIITLSESQFDGLTAMIKGEDTPFIEDGDGLGKRVLWTKKEKRKGRTGGKYNAVVWDADEEELGMPDMELDQELIDIDLSENYAIDREEVDKVYALISGQEIEEPAEDEEVELEGDSEGAPDNAALDDLEEDEDPDAEEVEEKEEEEEDDFEDDIPGEEEEEELPAKKRPPTARPSTGKPKTSSVKASKGASKPKAQSTAAVKKTTSGMARKMGSRKSRKARM